MNKIDTKIKNAELEKDVNTEDISANDDSVEITDSTESVENVTDVSAVDENEQQEEEENNEAETTDTTEKTEVLDNKEDLEDAEDTTDKLFVKANYDSKEKLAVASTSVVDRHNERINQEGWDLKNFKNNPVMLWAHDHTEIAVGVCKNIHIERKNGSARLVFTPEFHDKTEKAKALKALFEEGWLNSFSVGFIPKDFDGKDSTYLKQELLEISAVNVPANPDARMLAYKSLVGKGFKKDTAKAVTGVTKEPVNKLFKKGAVADEINSEEVWEQKSELIHDAQDIFWAFCDVYYSEETAVNDFTKLLKETITLLSKVADGTYNSPDVGEPQDEPVEDSVKDDKTEVLDKVSDKSNDDNKTAKTQENTDTSVAPKTNLSKEDRAKQSLVKVIAGASDKLLGKKQSEIDAEMYAKVIKRAAEILSKSSKN